MKAAQASSVPDAHNLAVNATTATFKLKLVQSSKKDDIISSLVAKLLTFDKQDRDAARAIAVVAAMESELRPLERVIERATRRLVREELQELYEQSF